MIIFDHLSKRHGDRLAVDDLSAEIRSGRVTGFLGPNGSGKSTTMRMVLGLDRPTAGRALIGGRHYRELRHPLRQVGALLDAGAAHPGRTARAHLRAVARTHHLPAARVDHVLELAGLTKVAGRRAGTFSLGMRQRLGIATALLGDPAVVILDEPINGLDPDGVQWIRRLMRSLAGEGRTVLVSSHLMSEMELTADQLLVIGRGRLIADEPIERIVAGSTAGSTAGGGAGGAAGRVTVRGPDLRELVRALEQRGAGVEFSGERLTVVGPGVEEVGETAHRLGVMLHELTVRRPSLEDAYLELTASAVEFGAER